MTVHLLSPQGMSPGTPYHHVAVGTGTRHVHVAGQVGSRPDGEPGMPKGLQGQVAQALRNTAVGLAAAGASFTDTLRLTFYVVDWEPAKMPELLVGIDEVATELGLPIPLPPASLIGVASLFEPGVLVEVEATALTD